ncbi:MAG: PglZ domain-containing protein [Bacteroidales bacterium]|nr:PglZ domain-containing protein [Bacteroidales bacterium]
MQNKIYKYFDLNPDLHVLFVFSLETKVDELDSYEWRPGYRYEKFNGAWFNTKYKILNDWKDEHVILAFEGLRPSTQAQMLNFPLMDILAVNTDYRDDDYEAFMQQNHISGQFTTFVQKHVGEMQLKKFQSVFKDCYGSNFNEDLGYRGLLTGYLGSDKLLDWDTIIIRLILLDVQSEDTKRDSFYRRLVDKADVAKYLQKKLVSIFGVGYLENKPQNRFAPVAESMKYNAIMQKIIADEKHDTYHNLKIDNSFQLHQINRIMGIAFSDKTIANSFESALLLLSEKIKEHKIIDCYGTEAEYYYMPETMCWPILKQLIANHLYIENEKLVERLHQLSVKQENHPQTQTTIDFVSNVACLYKKIDDYPSLKFNYPEDYIKQYTQDLYLVDTYYRKALNSFDKISKIVPVYDDMMTVKRCLDVDYANFTNTLNIEWTKCLTEKGHSLIGLKDVRLQQNFYAEICAPHTEKMALIICDALRFEIAAEIMSEIAKRRRHIAELDYAIAMLPTETKYCKQALLPHKTLELQHDSSMLVDGKYIATTDDRTEQVKRYNENAVCYSFANFDKKNSEEKREMYKNQLVIVFYDDIDESGHKASTRTQVLNIINNAVTAIVDEIYSILSSYNITDVYLTADHGFLYNDMDFADKDKLEILDSTIDQKNRYYLTNSNVERDYIAKFNIEDVSGMTAEGESVYVAVPKGTNRFYTQGGGYGFTHGGSSLQELIIPVLHCSQQRSDERQEVTVTLFSRKLSVVSGHLKVTLAQIEPVSMTHKKIDAVCALYCNNELVSNEKVVTFNSTGELRERMFDVDLLLTKQPQSNILELRVYKSDDMMNPIIRETVTNNTLIERDF